MKSKTTALLLSIFLGGLGVDRFYLGYTGMGILKLLTGGGFGILAIYDLIMIACGNLGPADGSPYQEDVNRANQPYGNPQYAQPQQPQQYGQQAAQAQQYGQQAQPQADPYEELKKLTDLYEQGVLTDDEYARMKAECLNRI